MRLLSVIHNPVFGGGGNQMLRLREPLERRGVTTLGAVPDEPGSITPRLREAGVEVHELRLHRLRATPDPRVQLPFLAGFPREVSALRALMHDRAIDVVQVHGPTNPHAAIAARRAGAAVVWQLYDTRTPMALRRLSMPLVVRLADVIMSTGRGVAEQHPGATSLGERLVPYVPPVDLAEFRPDPALRRAARQRLGVPDDAVLVGSVGNMNPSKGHEHLVRALALLAPRAPAVRAVIAGADSPPHAAWQLQVRAEAAQLGDSVRLLVEDVDVPALMPGLDVLAVTSVPRSEGIPTVILEAMACGLPVVATDVGALREVVEEDVTGYVVPPLDPPAIADALERVVLNAELRARLGATALERARERYGLEQCADTHLAAYRLAAEHRRALSGGR